MLYFAKARKVLLWAGAFFFLLALRPSGASPPQAFERGNLVGTVFSAETRAPIAGAVVKLRNISTGSVYESPPTDAKGYFRLDGIGKGIYQYGITTAAGDFNSSELIGIIANETTKVSVSLSAYDTAVQGAVQEVLRTQASSEGESRIGRVVRYNPATKMAEVFIELGVLQRNDRIRVKGVVTNFYQDAVKLVLAGSDIRRLMAGQTGLLQLTRPAEPGDGVFVTCKGGGVPFFMTPCGIATVIAGTGLILGTVKEITDKTPVSQFK